jgi:hypothetical protein
MDEPQLIWRLGRWIAHQSSGAARLAWATGEIVLRLRSGRVVSAEGQATEELSRRLECAPAGRADLLDEAWTLAQEQDIDQVRAVGAAKELVQEAVQAWLLDPDRELELVDGEPDAGDGPTISITHAIVELILNDTDRNLCSMVLPDLNLLLRRADAFIDLYAPLRLTEDADLIVAKITGQRTAEEIATRSPHGPEDVIRLLAALVATGMLEPTPVDERADEVEIVAPVVPDQQATHRRLPVAWIVVGGIALVAVLVLAVVWFARTRATASAAPSGHWTVVVDMGCEPQDLQRILRKANADPKNLHALRADPGEDDSCWRLVWGDFPTLEESRTAIDQVPSNLLRNGFEPHPLELEGPPGGEEESGS